MNECATNGLLINEERTDQSERMIDEGVRLISRRVMNRWTHMTDGLNGSISRCNGMFEWFNADGGQFIRRYIFAPPNRDGNSARACVHK